MMKIRGHSLLLVLSVVAFLLLKIYLVQNIFPSSGEELLFLRGKLLITQFHDEYGRFLPFFFTSRFGYQFPLISYIFSPFTLLGFIPYLYIGELAISISMILTLLKIFSSKKTFFILVLFSPIFLLPYFWEIKAATILLIYITFHLKERRLHPLVLILFSLISFDTFVISTFILFLILIRHKNFSTLIFFIVAFGIWFSFLKLPNSLNHIQENNLALIKDSEITSSINSFRGEDVIFLRGSASRLFHNKTDLAFGYFENMMLQLDPSYNFGRGDQDKQSGSFLIPPLLPFLVAFFLIGIFKLFKSHPGRIEYIWFFILFSFVSLKGRPQLELNTYLLIPFFLYVSSFAAKFFKPKVQYFLLLLSFIYSAGAVHYFISFQSQDRLTYSTMIPYSISQFLKSHPTDKVVVTDEFLRDPGPSLAVYTNSYIPNSTKPFSYRSHLRDISKNIQVISPKDIDSFTYDHAFVVKENKAVEKLNLSWTKLFPISKDKSIYIYHQHEI